MERGTANVNVAIGKSEVTIRIPGEHTTVPTVAVLPYIGDSNGEVFVALREKTASTITLNVNNTRDVAMSMRVDWVAIF